MPNFTNKQLQEMIDRHVEQEREGAIVGMMLCALSGGAVGFFAAYGLKLAGWI